MHHKRKKPKFQRSGCLLCHPHKGNGSNGDQAQAIQELKARLSEREYRKELRDKPDPTDD